MSDFPVGTMWGFRPGESLPGVWLDAEGQAYDPDEYPELHDVIGTTFGAAPNLPDTRGRRWLHPMWGSLPTCMRIKARG